MFVDSLLCGYFTDTAVVVVFVDMMLSKVSGGGKGCSPRLGRPLSHAGQYVLALLLCRWLLGFTGGWPPDRRDCTGRASAVEKNATRTLI